MANEVKHTPAEIAAHRNEIQRLVDLNAELLAALRAAVEYHGHYGDEYAWLDAARAVIAKAEGK